MTCPNLIYFYPIYKTVLNGDSLQVSVNEELSDDSSLRTSRLDKY